MILDAEARQADWFDDRRFAVCVVGTGPAGLSLALSLARQGKDVALMEGGGEFISFESQDIYEADVVGREYFSPAITRLRYLGGSSNHWGGWSGLLNAHDFEPRPFHPRSGWPITKADIDPYAKATEAFLDLPPERPPSTRSLGTSVAPFEQFDIRFSRTKRLAERYRQELESLENLRLFLHANLVDLELDDRLQRVTAGVFRSFERDDLFRVNADAYVLCLGGLENPRALLNANRQIARGIGNQQDLVGRFFCEHPHQTVARVILNQPMGRREFYAPSAAYMAEHQILNAGLRLIPDYPELLFGEEIGRSLACSADFIDRIIAGIRGRRANCDRGGLRAYYEQWRNPEMLLTARVDMASEQALNPDSRVRLSQSRTDDFGLPRIELDWRLSPLDAHTQRTATVAFGQLLAKLNAGRLQVADWLLEDDVVFPSFDDDAEVGGHHHMCTTRMSDDPRQGVVDRNCRVHGTDNLFMGGSSVFATTGHINPTVTIVQLALRLADHLQAET
jgi:choline dehydrogenase-like flavoprotein